MSIAASSLGARPLSDQTRAGAATTIPASRILVPKGDAALVPEPR